MIHSMTAFARQESRSDWGTLVWEVRSINHRYLECFFKLPEPLTELEPVLRDLLKQQLQRGKVDVFLRFKNDNKVNGKLIVNEDLLQQLISLSQQAQQKISGNATLNSMDLLAWPGVIQTAEVDITAVKMQAVASFEQVLISLIAMRKREGDALAQFIEQRLQALTVELAKVKQHLPAVLMNQRVRIEQKLAEINASFDMQRLEQEMVLFAQRIDVDEELNRLETHLQEVQHCLTEGGAQGRRLDFLMQELNREANTLGSKAGDAVISSIAISLKVLIEQMREQIQNIE